jgi:hypothetical protein
MSAVSGEMGVLRQLAATHEPLMSFSASRSADSAAWKAKVRSASLPAMRAEKVEL